MLDHWYNVAVLYAITYKGSPTTKKCSEANTMSSNNKIRCAIFTTTDAILSSKSCWKWCHLSLWYTLNATCFYLNAVNPDTYAISFSIFESQLGHEIWKLNMHDDTVVRHDVCAINTTTCNGMQQNIRYEIIW